jgi:hypothetical protein
MPKIKKCKASFINSIPFLVIGISRTDYRQMVKERLPLKKIAPSGGRCEKFWGISCEKS